MKIAYATDSYWPRMSGMAVSIDTFRTELEALGHEVHVLAPEYAGSKALDVQAGRRNVHRFASWNLYFSSEDRLVKHSAEPAVFRLLDRLQPDIIHAHSEVLMSRAAWRYARSRGIPLVMTAHTHWEQYINNYLPFPPAFGRALARTIMRRALGTADVVVTPSQHMKAVLESYGIHIPIEVIPTGFESRAFQGVSRDEEHAKSFLFEAYPQLKDRTVLLTVGRVAQEKNLEFLVDVVARLVPQLPNLAWLLVGDGPALPAIRRKVARLGLENHVVMPGYIARDKVKFAYGLADIFVFASKTETQGLATVEALSSGLPVVALDEMGTCDVLAGELGGFLVQEDVAAFAERVLQLATDDRLRRQKVLEARLVANRWSPRLLAKAMLNLYEGLVPHGSAQAEAAAQIARFGT